LPVTSSTIQESCLLMPCEFKSSLQFYEQGSILWTILWSGLAPNMHYISLRIPVDNQQALIED